MMNKLTAQLDEVHEEQRRQEPVKLELLGGEDRLHPEVRPSLLPPGTPALLNASEASRLLRISRNAVYSLVAQNQLPSIRLGRRVVIPSAAISKMIAEVIGGQG